MGKRSAGVLRIIGGHWRSRHILFDDRSGVRPTPDRVRQTVFDWLAPYIDGATCLDLFAGSGALGLEALSRGAARADFVDNQARQVAAIERNLNQLGTGDAARVCRSDAAAFLRGTSQQYDLVFLDPPYGSDMLDACLIQASARLKPGGLMYLEWGGARVPALPPGLVWHRTRRAGQVSFGLALSSVEDDASNCQGDEE